MCVYIHIKALCDHTNPRIHVILTWIFDGCDNEPESVRVGAPGVRYVLQGDEVGVRVDGSDALHRVPTGQVRLEENEKEEKKN